MLSLPEDVRRLVEAIEQVVGPLRPLNDLWEASSHWHLVGSYRGREVLFLVETDQSMLNALHYGVSLGDRPITIAIHSPNVSLFGVPRVATGDPVFDARFVAFGFPREVLSDLLDPGVRRFLFDEYGPIPEGLIKPASIDPQLRTEGHYLMWYRHLRVMDGILATSRGRVPAPDEIQRWLEHAIALADRAAASFDHHYAAIAAAHGPEAAARWVDQQRGAMAERATRRKRIRMVFFAFVAVMVLLPLLAAGCILAAVVLGGGSSIRLPL